MKKIGLVVFDLSECDFKKYLDLIRNASKEKYFNGIVNYYWSPIRIYKKVLNDEIEICENLKLLCSKSDIILVLPAENPERFLSCIEKILYLGKNIYIYKNFMEDSDVAEKIYGFMENRKRLLL